MRCRSWPAICIFTFSSAHSRLRGPKNLLQINTVKSVGEKESWQERGLGTTALFETFLLTLYRQNSLCEPTIVEINLLWCVSGIVGEVGIHFSGFREIASFFTVNNKERDLV